MGWLLTGCYTLRPLPSTVPPGASPVQVANILGNPQYVTPVKRNPQVAQVWSYRDEWHTPVPRSIWKSRDTGGWASWDVYFDSQDHFTGWRLVEPAPPLPAARQVAWDLSKGDAQHDK